MLRDRPGPTGDGKTRQGRETVRRGSGDWGPADAAGGRTSAWLLLRNRSLAPRHSPWSNPAQMPRLPAESSSWMVTKPFWGTH